MRGRTAYYGRKHLLQLVAIKRLQAQGLPLADIQQKLLGADKAKLKKLAQLSDEALTAITQRAPEGESAAAASTPARETRFWERAPQWQASESVKSEPSLRPAVLVPICPGASLMLENVPSDRLSSILHQLAPALDMLRGALTQSGVLPTNTESPSQFESTGKPQENQR
jgi:DNA-binding transcriptional MerR regulator